VQSVKNIQYTETSESIAQNQIMRFIQGVSYEKKSGRERERERERESRKVARSEKKRRRFSDAKFVPLYAVRRKVGNYPRNHRHKWRK